MQRMTHVLSNFCLEADYLRVKLVILLRWHPTSKSKLLSLTASMNFFLFQDIILRIKPRLRYCTMWGWRETVHGTTNLLRLLLSVRLTRHAKLDMHEKSPFPLKLSPVFHHNILYQYSNRCHCCCCVEPNKLFSSVEFWYFLISC